MENLLGEKEEIKMSINKRDIAERVTIKIVEDVQEKVIDTMRSSADFLEEIADVIVEKLDYDMEWLVDEIVENMFGGFVDDIAEELIENNDFQRILGEAVGDVLERRIDKEDIMNE